MGVYKLHDKTRYNLDLLSYEEVKLFKWMMKEYQAATSWAEFQERTAKRVVETAVKIQKSKRRKGDEKFTWENYSLYRIRFDMLRNVGIRTDELKGELSDMIIEEKKE